MNPQKVSENLRFFNVFSARRTFAMGPRMAQALKNQENSMLFITFYAKSKKTQWFCLLFSAHGDDLTRLTGLSGPSRAEPGQAGPSQAGSEPSRAEPGRAGPSRAKPSRAGPGRAEPRRIRATPRRASRMARMPRWPGGQDGQAAKNGVGLLLRCRDCK
jgi:hypothetical protein